MTIDRISQDFFTGIEVENSPAKGMNTLFVVGVQPATEILKLTKELNIRHVYIGANMSLHHIANDDYYAWKQIDDMINGVLEELSIEYLTVDFDVDQVEGFLESMASDNNRVIPMVSVKLPYTRLLNYNTTVKIDDIDFNKTNPGVWCVPLEELTKRKHFTPWSAYKGDSSI